MKKFLLLLPIAILLFGSCAQNTTTKEQGPISLEIKDGYYYINGEKTFISSIGYEIGARPGEHPYKDKRVLQESRMRNDLKLIKEAGFNSIRTWSDLTEEELKIVQESGLYLIYGFWIEPHEAYSDSAYIKNAFEHMRKGLAYTKNYDCIITYLVMNEPLPLHIHEQGAKATMDLWRGLRDIVHEMHPGIPVTISNNSRPGDFINERIFDVYGYNTYDHNEDHIYTQEFGPHFKWLKELNGEDKPLLITEFGMSVSKIGYGMYGGNTYKKQAEWVIRNYTGVLDGGAAGACPFYYADGWWKAGEADTHDPLPEAWFGYWGYSDINDTVGYPRPVWYDITKYIQALITSPRNQEIYTNQVPVEVFLTDKVSHVRALYHDKIILDEKGITKKRFTGTLDFGDEEMLDREIVFEFFNDKEELIKYETIMLLTSKEDVPLPTVSVAVAEKDMSKSPVCKATMTVKKNNSPFTLDNELKYIFIRHVDWEAGENQKQLIDPSKATNIIKANYTIPEKCHILTVSAGIDIKFGKFVKRIHGEELIYRGDWADEIRVN